MEYYKNLTVDTLSEPDGEAILFEEWMPVIDYEGIYEVSSFGRIKSLSRLCKSGVGHRKIKERILSQAENQDGYLLAHLSHNAIAEMRLVNRMVAIAFIPNPENKATVNHKWGNKKDNRKKSLEWHTNQENNQHSYDVLGRRSGTLGKKGKDCHISKKIICLNDKKKFDSMRDAARYYKVSESCIGQVCLGRQKKLKNGLTFKYIK